MSGSGPAWLGTLMWIRAERQVIGLGAARNVSCHFAETRAREEWSRGIRLSLMCQRGRWNNRSMAGVPNDICVGRRDESTAWNVEVVRSGM